ncbi:MAG: ribonuclease HI family protein [Parcubacteria group bacterium]
MNVEIYSDGGARGNPGPAGIGGVIRSEGIIIATYHEYIGEATNNQAEYRAVLRGLEEAKKLGAINIQFVLDSELVVSQLRREYKVKNKDLATLFVQVWNASQQFKTVKYRWVPRERNHEADALVNKAIDGAL